MTYGSVCSGIESASVAWEPLGLKPLWFSEIEPFPCSVLAHRWPDVPNLGDMNNLPELLRSDAVERPDILVGGTPCQAFSVAGARKGLADERGGLTLKFVEIANEMPESTVVWENVPGVLSSKDNAFGCFLAALAGENEPLVPAPRPDEGKSGKRWRWDKKLELHVPRWTNAGCVLGPQRTVAWRIFDAQYFGVAQRRCRVFVVACPAKGTDPRKILFESEGMRRDTSPSRETGSLAAALASDGVGAGGADDQARHLAAMAHGQGGGGVRTDGLAPTVTCNHEVPLVTHTLRGEGFDASEDGTGRGTPLVVHGTQDPIFQTDRAFPVGRNNGGENVLVPGVRRITPVEGERLQGFPDGHTAVPHRGKPAADGPRYKAIGNSKAVPVVQWIGRRLISCSR